MLGIRPYTVLHLPLVRLSSTGLVIMITLFCQLCNWGRL